MKKALWGVVGVVMGCSEPVGDARWAFDQIVIDPAAPGGPVALQTWQLHDAQWPNNQDNGYRHVCDVLSVAQLEVSDTPCDVCDVSYEVTSVEVSWTTCDNEQLAELPMFLSLKRVGIGQVSSAVETTPRVKGAVGGWVDVGNGWEPHGWSWPDGADRGEAEMAPWDGTTAFWMEPAFAWEILVDPGANNAQDEVL